MHLENLCRAPSLKRSVLQVRRVGPVHCASQVLLDAHVALALGRRVLTGLAKKAACCPAGGHIAGGVDVGFD